MARGRLERFAQAKRAREQQARRQADEERLRIAQELHDVLAHNISLINVQAGVALHLMDEQPEQARDRADGDQRRRAPTRCGEVRSVLGVLRGPARRRPGRPTAGLTDLDDLCSPHHRGWRRRHAEVHGERRPLPASVDLAAFRIVQEALTNVVRHAGASAAHGRARPTAPTS